MRLSVVVNIDDMLFVISAFICTCTVNSDSSKGRGAGGGGVFCQVCQKCNYVAVECCCKTGRRCVKSVVMWPLNVVAKQGDGVSKI